MQNEEKYLNEKADSEQSFILLHLRGNNLSQKEKEVYELLTTMEKQIGWNKLIEARDEVFTKGDEFKVDATAINNEKKDSKSQKKSSRGEEEVKNDNEQEELKVPQSSNERSIVAISIGNEPKVKRSCEKLDNLLQILNDDLYALYYWEQEEATKSDVLSNLL